MILDTCYAARGGSNTAGPTKGANEVIAATNEVDEAPGVSRLSFTRVLVRVLKNFAEKHRTQNLQLSAVWLCTHMRNYYYDQELKKPPYYVSLVNYRFDSCRIVPQPHSRNNFLGGLSPLMPPNLGPFRVTVAIHLKESPSGDLVSWLQGQGAPAGYIDGIGLIKIQAVHLANSSMLLVALPPAVWLLLPPNIPCTFLGLTRSGNLLAKQIGSSTAMVRTENISSSSMDDVLVLDPPPPFEEKAVLLSRKEFDLQLRRQNKYWEDRVSGNVRSRSSPDQYKYLPLAPLQFRLIKVLRGQDKDGLSGKMSTVYPTSAPQYVALSYVWGPPCEEGQDPPIIILDDVAIELRPNHDSALRALRRLDQDVYIWIDALCINQYDETEKDMQIPLMADIYRVSNSVAIWLGEASSYGTVAFAFARWITRHPDHVGSIAEQQLKVLITAFFDMIRNPWFQRKWIVADFVLAKELNLHYGNDVLPWNVMAGAVYVLRYRALDLLQLFLHKGKHAEGFLDFLADFRYQGVNESVDLRHDMQRELLNPQQVQSRNQLDELVTRTALLNASRFHDAVYSMISLAYGFLIEVQSPLIEASQPEDRPPPPPETTWLSSSAGVPLESTQSSSRTSRLFDSSTFRRGLWETDYDLPVRDVCSKFVGHTIEMTRQLDIICRPWAPEAPDLPSWVRPRSEHAFRVLDDNRYCRVNADGLATLTSTRQTLYSACGKDYLLDADTILSALSQDSSLIVTGFQLGLISVTAPPAINGVLPKEWREFGGLGPKTRISDEDYWRILVADRDATGLACPGWYKLASEHILQNSDGVDLDIRRLMFESPPGIVFEFLRRVQSVIWGRRLAALDEGYVVLGPRSCEAGDLVCILLGCSVPVILRPHDYMDLYSLADPIDYTFVGECYVHGMMDGEVRVLEKQGRVPAGSFKLY